MNRTQALGTLRRITDGIDRTESDERPGWWETSTGAGFGAEVLDQLVDLVADLTPEPTDVQVRAANLRKALDEELGRKTPEDIERIADGEPGA